MSEKATVAELIRNAELWLAEIKRCVKAKKYYSAYKNTAGLNSCTFVIRDAMTWYSAKAQNDFDGPFKIISPGEKKPEIGEFK